MDATARDRRHQDRIIHLVGPGGAGKSTVGAVLAARLGVPFFDLDTYFTERAGDISSYIDRHGYEAYAHENCESYRSGLSDARTYGVMALSSGFMTYPQKVHPSYVTLRSEVEVSPTTFVLLPSLDYEVCVAETVRRQVARPFARSLEREEAVIRERYAIFMALPAPKVETMRAASDAAEEIVEASSKVLL